MAEEYKVLLGLELESGSIDKITTEIKNIKSDPIPIVLDTDEAKGKIKDLHDSLKQLKKSLTIDLKGANNQIKIPEVNFSGINRSLERLDRFIDEIHTSIGTLGDNNEFRPLVASINEIRDAVSNVVAEFRTLSETMGRMNFSLNIGTGSNSNNPIVNTQRYSQIARRDTIPELQNRIRQIGELLMTYNSYAHDADEAAAQFLIRTNARNRTGVDSLELLNEIGDSSNLRRQMDSLRTFLDLLQRGARDSNIDLSNITSGWTRSADDLIEGTQRVLAGVDEVERNQEALRNIFNVDLSGIEGQLTTIITRLEELNTALGQLNNNSTSFNNFEQIFSGLSTSVQGMTDGLSRIENVLNSLGGQVQLQDLSQSFVDLANAINLAMTACQNIDNNLSNGQRAISEVNNVTADVASHATDLEAVMNSLGFDQSDIQRAIKELDKLDVTITKIAKHLHENGIDLTVYGVDQFGDNVTLQQRLRRRTRKDGSVETTTSRDVKIAENVGRVAKPIDEVADAYERMVTARKRMAEMENKQIGLDESISANTKIIEISKKEYQKALADYQRISSEYWSRLSNDQQNYIREMTRQLKQDTQLLKLKAESAKQKKEKSQDEVKDRASKTAYDNYKLNKGGQENRVVTNLNKIQKQTKETTEAFQRYQDAIQKLDSFDGSESTQDRITALVEYKRALKEVEVQIKKNLDAETLQRKDTSFDLDKKTVSFGFDSWLKKNSEAAIHFSARVEDIKRRLQECDAVELSNIKKEIQALKREAEAAGKTTKSFGDRLTKQFQQLGMYFSLDYIIDLAVDAIRDMYDQVVEIDTAMTDLLKVTDETSSRYEQFLGAAQNSAKELGRSVSSYITQSAKWAQMGYSIGDSEELAKISSIYSNVADVDDATAVSNIVANLKAFDLQASDAVTIVDTLNKLGKLLPTRNYIG